MPANPIVNVEVKLDRAAIEKLAGSRDVVRALTIVGQIGEAAAKSFAPVDTGTLRRSITYEVGKRGIEPYVRIGTNISYAVFQELGTVNHMAHPFLRPALTSIEQAIKSGAIEQ